MRAIKITLLLLLTSHLLFAQVPQGIPYQAIARDLQGQPLANSSILVRFSILDSSATGNVVYVEKHSALTNTFGLFSLNVGMGSPMSGLFSNINWPVNFKFLKIEIDISGTGSNYVDLGTQQMMTVPYAFFCGSSAITARGGAEGQVLTFCNGSPVWTTGGQCPGRVTAVNCSTAITTGLLSVAAAVSGVSVTISYSGGNGGAYPAQLISSTGVTGLTASLAAGSFANGSGSVNYVISGTPSMAGFANFSIILGGQSCVLSLPVNAFASSVATLNCSSASTNGTLTAGVSVSGFTSTITYTGGNGGAYPAQLISSTDVTGLTASLAAGSFANGSGSVNYVISGTPSMAGSANFSIILGGQSCVLSLSVNDSASIIGSSASCGATNIHNPALSYGTMSDQEGNVYKTIIIGNQEWMAENLNTRTYRNGDLIPEVSSGSQWTSLTTGAYCWYSNDSATYSCPYGRLYNGRAVIDQRNLCPTGWHVPSDADWSVLETFLGGAWVAGGKMKSVGTQYWTGPSGASNPVNVPADNSSGFSALPGGYRVTSTSYWLGSGGVWWSTTSSPIIAGGGLSNRAINHNRADLYLGSGALWHGNSVRCLRD